MNPGKAIRVLARFPLVAGAVFGLVVSAPPELCAAEGFAPQRFTFPVQAWIPDGHASGLADAQTLPAGPGPILSVWVTLELSPHPEGAFLGDLYVSLSGPTVGYSVLLNRPGRTAVRPFGYSDGGDVQITLSDAATADVHSYRLTLTGDESVPLAAPLTGLWQPDARPTDPARVVTDDPRTARLASFAGEDQSGTWVLFAADLSSGGQYRLDAWSLEVHYIPEPAPPGLLIVAFLMGCARRIGRPLFSRISAPFPAAGSRSPHR